MKQIYEIGSAEWQLHSQFTVVQSFFLVLLAASSISLLNTMVESSSFIFATSISGNVRIVAPRPSRNLSKISDDVAAGERKLRPCSTSLTVKMSDVGIRMPLFDSDGVADDGTPTKSISPLGRL